MLAKAKRFVRRMLDGGVKLGEIKNDRLYWLIKQQASRPDVKTMLEIGSSTGDGSTAAFAEGMATNPSHPQLFCIEAVKDRFEILKKRYQSNPAIHCYNTSSVKTEDYPSEEFVRDFIRVANSNMGDPDTVLGWRRGEIDYVQANHLEQDGIATIKKEHGIDHFDLVLLDGSEFTGQAELDAVYGSRIILMDDIRALKNYYNCMRVLYDARYRLIDSDLKLRGGFAAFELR